MKTKLTKSRKSSKRTDEKSVFNFKGSFILVITCVAVSTFLSVLISSSIQTEVNLSSTLIAPKPNIRGDNINADVDVDEQVASDASTGMSYLMEGQMKRLELFKAGIAPILPGPDEDELTRLAKDTNDDSSITKYLDDIGEWKYKLYSRLDNIRLHCGGLCQLNSPEEIEKYHAPKEEGEAEDGNSFYLPTVVVPDVNCPALLGLEDIDAGDMTFPVVPDELLGFYNMTGNVIVKREGVSIRKDAYLGGSAEKSSWSTGNVWNEGDINDAVAMVKSDTLAGPYGLPETITVKESLNQVDMKGKSVLVIGSSHPWIEAICLFHGAAKVTTLEYGEIISNHPQIETETPSTMRKKYQDGTLEEFDGIVTQSSVEHSGLGRYGDTLNPWGDILAIARAWCVSKPKAFMWVGVPTGADRVYSNWHRIYGIHRWPVLATNWKLIGKDVQFGDPANMPAVFGRGPFKGMMNMGLLFEKIDPK